MHCGSCIHQEKTVIKYYKFKITKIQLATTANIMSSVNKEVPVSSQTVF